MARLCLHMWGNGCALSGPSPQVGRAGGGCQASRQAIRKQRARCSGDTEEMRERSWDQTSRGSHEQCVLWGEKRLRAEERDTHIQGWSRRREERSGEWTARNHTETVPRLFPVPALASCSVTFCSTTEGKHLTFPW